MIKSLQNYVIVEVIFGFKLRVGTYTIKLSDVCRVEFEDELEKVKCFLITKHPTVHIINLVFLNKLFTFLH